MLNYSSPLLRLSSATGQITVGDVLQLDFDTTPSFTLDVAVADSVGLTDTATIIINLIDEDPELLLMTDPDPGIAGVNNTVIVSEATSGEVVQFAFEIDAGSTPVPG
jgi:hypothetical protein